MSVQLILYPQTYEGQYNSISANANEFVVNGINIDEYFSHRYNLISTTPTVVTDPATQ